MEKVGIIGIIGSAPDWMNAESMCRGLLRIAAADIHVITTARHVSTPPIQGCGFDLCTLDDLDFFFDITTTRDTPFQRSLKLRRKKQEGGSKSLYAFVKSYCHRYYKIAEGVIIHEKNKY